MPEAARKSQPVYVYGVVPAGELGTLRTRGVAERPLQLVEHDGIAAVVSEFPADDIRVRRRDLHAHLRSLEDIFRETVVAPCAFGTVMASREDVERELLAGRRDELRELLRRLEGQAQMNVKVEYDEQALIEQVVREEPEVGRARERVQALGDAAYYENIRLGELVAASIAVRRERDADAIAQRLAATATDWVADSSTNELRVFKGSFLVATDRLEEFDGALESLAAEGGEQLRFESFGPLPPTAFATLGPAG
jgi:hypothetical protein